MSLSPDVLYRLQNTLVDRMEAAGRMPLEVAHGSLTASARTPAGHSDHAR